MILEYRSINDLNSIILNKLSILPKDIDLVVGIPRSGMLPANLIALYLNKKFTDVDSFIRGQIYSSGDRESYISSTRFKNILIVDDSINAGRALDKTKSKVYTMTNIADYKISWCAIYASKDGSKKVDYYFEVIDCLRLFQWNVFHHPSFIPKSCFDIDGVLCENPPIDDDGPIYLKYLEHAIPKFIPSLEIDTLVTCRLEKYRAVTEKWLKDNNVKYKNLVMLPFQTKQERIRWGKHGEYKGEVYKKGEFLLFVESSLAEAKEIYRVSQKPVFCVENFELIYQNTPVRRAKHNLKKFLKQLFSKNHAN